MSTADRYCVMGNPIAHSRSPRIHSLFAELTGQSLVYERELVPLDAFEASLRQLVQSGTRGMNVTVPFKLDAARLADTRSDRVALCGAANTLVVGTDGQVHHAVPAHPDLLCGPGCTGESFVGGCHSTGSAGGRASHAQRL